MAILWGWDSSPAWRARGGNVTGLSFSVGMETFGKGLELLREAIPKVRRVGVLSNPANPAHVL
ncbi:MAG TPA: hypothetical protein VLD61_10925, partial [Methylomirabilota bacterium]|nr:hypothetical protein [Methylomirabilota bacterium]